MRIMTTSILLKVEVKYPKTMTMKISMLAMTMKSDRINKSVRIQVFSRTMKSLIR